MNDRIETTTERHLAEAEAKGRRQAIDEILEYIVETGSAARNMQLQLLVIKLESME